MARQGGGVQLEQSDMRLALNMAKMAKGGLSLTAIEETQYLINKPRAEVRKENKESVELPGHKKVMAAIDRPLAMLHQNHTPGCLPCQNGTAKNPQTRWRCKGTDAPPPNQCRHQTAQPTAEPMPPLPGTPPTSTGNTFGSQRLEIVNLLARYAYSHTSVRCAESFTLDISAQDSEHNTDFDPDMLPDERTSTG